MPGSCGSLLQQLRKVLFRRENVGPGITGLFQQFRGCDDREVSGINLVQTFPLDRHRDGAESMPPRREDRGERFSPAVLVVIEEDLPGSALDRPFESDILRPLLKGIATNGLGDVARGVEVEASKNGDIDVEASSTGGLDERFQAQS